ncbi:MAG TPA: hypothetical protein VIQ31_06565, partial [Phormidium sp.]
PGNANELLAKIRKISSQTITSSFTKALFQIISKLPTDLFKFSLAILALFAQLINQTISLSWQTISHLIKAFFSTLWLMILGGIGGCLGAVIGSFLAYKTAFGQGLDDFVSQYLLRLTSIPILLKSGFLLFACAGLATAWGLMLAGKLGQQRRYFIATMMGIISYGLGWLIVQKSPSSAILPDDLILMTAVATFLLTLGLGLPSHQIVYALVSAVGTACVFAGLLLLVMQFLPVTAFFGISDTFFNSFNWTNFAFSIAFFSTMGIIIGFWLSVTHFLVVPVLRMLGWR